MRSSSAGGALHFESNEEGTSCPLFVFKLQWPVNNCLPFSEAYRSRVMEGNPVCLA